MQIGLKASGGKFLRAGFVGVAGLFSTFACLAQTYSQTEVITYSDNTSKWVLGQVARSTVDGSVVSEVEFNSNAQPKTFKSFGKLQQSLTYHADGNVATVTDGNNNVTTLGGWTRGIPRSIEFEDGSSRAATVDGVKGWLTSVTDELGYTTSYTYDPMGRLATIAYPAEDSGPWKETTQLFELVNGMEYGIQAGHWRQTVATGDGKKLTYFDALWRPLLVHEYDAADKSGTQRFQRFAYDPEGHVIFASYPGVSHEVDTGTWTEYDSLGRTTVVSQDSELGLLTTLTDYLDGFQTRVTDAKENQTTTAYRAYDQPTFQWPVGIAHPEGVYTEITRNTFGNPLTMTRRNSDGSVALTRSYTYNNFQELCRSLDPETGATLKGYDGFGNLAWSASGLTAGTPCEASGNTAAILARRITRTYDARNRLETLSFPDGEGNQTWDYTPDGLPSRIVTTMLSDTHIVTNRYTYNRRRLLATETQELTGWGAHTLAHTYDANGHLASLIYPASYLGSIVDYDPNALGQPTKAGIFASDVTYHPNGAIKAFTYGNGLKHTLTQNPRGLPDTSCDFASTCNTAAVLNDGYDYDRNGNVMSISDGRADHPGNRTMTYDDLNRLTSTVSSDMFGTATYTYDVLDNLTRVRVTGGNRIRDHYYCYDAKWQLTNVKTNGCTGETITGLGYDLQGNLAQRNEVIHKFDYGNRLREVVNRENQYWYDGFGRRVASNRLVNGSGVLRSVYGLDGKLLFTQDQGEAKRREYIYLGGNLLAERSLPNSGAATPVNIRYQHTDALGSPVAITNESQMVVEETKYEPYGWAANRLPRNGPGYTGHHEDAATGLVYMQQRYYDPILGRFLSRDPVNADASTGANFNAYWYANNNPYRFSDPDGRQSWEKIKEFILPSTTALGSRGEPGTAASNLTGAAKQGFNQLSSAAGMASGNPAAMINAPQLPIASNELAGAAIVEVGTAAAGAFTGLATRAGNLPSRFGDLTKAEAKAIQSVVNQAGRPLDVVGSAASGTRRGVGTDLPIGKGPGTRSDIDYTTAGSNSGNFDGLQQNLPSLAPHGILQGAPDAGLPSIRFEPKP
ncbi:RHS repeat domain-containing protein [Luteimonas notoginsengisoli]|uniref:RHS repeat domain-containing protein n=1 Tax=Luteimonas notoginsengisoli TaxID=1578200 RepID=A0ABV7UUE1_9GAMM